MRFFCKKHCIGYADSRIDGIKFSEECGIFGGASKEHHIAVMMIYLLIKTRD